MPKYLLGSVLLFVFVLSALLTFTVLSGRNNSPMDLVVASDVSSQETPSEAPLSFNLSSHNFLLLGYGGAGHDGGNLSDVIMVVNLNTSSKQITFVSIPRDLWVEIPVRSDIKESHKVNAAYAIGTDDKKYGLKEPRYRGNAGGGNMAKKVVSEVAGLKITNFVAVDFENYKKIIDSLGGVEVEVPNTFDDHLYPVKGLENETCGFSPEKIRDLHVKYSGFDLEKQFICRYEHIHFDKGKTKMNGDTALKFVRSRHSAQDGGDFARSRRQQAIIMAVKAKILSLNAVKNSEELYKEFSGLIRTDLDLEGFKNLYTILKPPEGYRVKFASLTTENVLTSTKSLNGQFILIPRAGEGVWNEVHSFVNKELTSN